MGELNDTLRDAGTGIGGFIGDIDNPLINFVILLGIAGFVVALGAAIVAVVKRSLGA